MSERVLKHEIHKQDNSYYCGPAATRTALSVRGIVVSESTLATKLRTTTAGTNSSADIVRGLNSYFGNLYAAVYIGHSATSAQKSKFRSDLVRSIDHEYAIVANVVGTGKDVGGKSYSYPGGHYVAVVGYRKSGAEALVSDVAIGRDYWMSTDALVNWIGGRGYAWPANIPSQPSHPTTVKMGDKFPLPSGHYYGDIKGPNESHGGYYPAERPAIKAIQRRLIELGMVPGITNTNSSWADGLFEQPTVEAVKRFQRSVGLPQTGRVDKATWEKLFPAPASAPAPAPKPEPAPEPEPEPVVPDVRPPLATTRAEIVANALGGVWPLGTVPYSMTPPRADCSSFVARCLGLPNPDAENTVTLVARGHVERLDSFDQARPGDLWGKMGEGTAGAAGHVAVIVSTPREGGRWVVVEQAGAMSPGPDRVEYGSPPSGYAAYRSLYLAPEASGCGACDCTEPCELLSSAVRRAIAGARFEVVIK